MKTILAILGASLIAFSLHAAEPTKTTEPRKTNCKCKDCKCTPENHCGCYSNEGCKCSGNEESKGCPCCKYQPENEKN